MQAIEFETTAYQHTIHIPEAIPDGVALRVLVLLNENAEQQLGDNAIRSELTDSELESACGILSSPRTVTLEQMETAL